MEESRSIASAKVVIVGDSGTGKSGLSLVLSGRNYTPTSSTHGLNVFEISDTLKIDSHHIEERKLFLWDLPGQPFYRITDSLFLKDTKVALITFDSGRVNEGVLVYWIEALKQSGLPSHKIVLVETRVDRGHTEDQDEVELEKLINRYNIDSLFSTSAAIGIGISPLLLHMKTLAGFFHIPPIDIKTLKLGEKILAQPQQHSVFSISLSDFSSSFVTAGIENPLQAATQSLEFLQTKGYVQLSSFGNLTFVNANTYSQYITSLFLAAASSEDGLGNISEETARNLLFPVFGDRISNKHEEQSLGIAIIDELIQRHIVFREVTGKGAYLIFPSQITRDNTPFIQPLDVIELSFEGAAFRVYLTLVVRLIHSSMFVKKDIWKNMVTFVAPDGSTCGIFYKKDGNKERIVLFFENTTPEIKSLFHSYVLTYLLNSVISTSSYQYPTLQIGNSIQDPIQSKVFVCYNSLDKIEIVTLADKLSGSQISYWMDTEDIDSGKNGLQEIEKQLLATKIALICFGPHGIGKWQELEIYALLQQKVDRGCKLIPVILSSCSEMPDLPLFLRNMQWIDLRFTKEGALSKLIAEILTD